MNNSDRPSALDTHEIGECRRVNPEDGFVEYCALHSPYADSLASHNDVRAAKGLPLLSIGYDVMNHKPPLE